MEVRPYAAADRDVCLALFDTNVPDSFAPAEREQFREFLEASATPYYLLEHEGTVVACGGFAVDAANSTARLCWGIVGHRFQRQGVGKFLLLWRLREIGRLANVRMVTLETTPKSATFFEKQGFRPVSVTADFNAPGLDKLEMVRKIAVCS